MIFITQKGSKPVEELGWPLRLRVRKYQRERKKEEGDECLPCVEETANCRMVPAIQNETRSMDEVQIDRQEKSPKQLG